MTAKSTNVTWTEAQSTAGALTSPVLSLSNGAVGIHTWGTWTGTVTLQAKPAVDTAGVDFQNTEIEITENGIYLSDRFPGDWAFRLSAASGAVDGTSFNAVLMGCEQEGG